MKGRKHVSPKDNSTMTARRRQRSWPLLGVTSEFLRTGLQNDLIDALNVSSNPHFCDASSLVVISGRRVLSLGQPAAGITYGKSSGIRSPLKGLLAGVENPADRAMVRRVPPFKLPCDHFSENRDRR